VKHVVVSIALLLTPLTLVAQNGTQTQLQTAPVLVFPIDAFPSPCPVAMQARQGVWDHSLKANQGRQQPARRGFGQRIILTTLKSGVVRATVRVHGLSGANRIFHTAEGQTSDDAVRTMTVTFSPRGDGAAADLYVPGFTSVSSVELREITHADGSVWKNPDSKQCRIVPDRMMLLADE
jgi:hypothetical protein